VKIRLLLSAILVLLSLVAVRCGTSAKYKKTFAATLSNVTLIPQGAYEQIILEHEGITEEEICQIYASNISYWNEVDKIMCGD
jgi:hypothetical protein